MSMHRIFSMLYMASSLLSAMEEDSFLHDSHFLPSSQNLTDQELKKLTQKDLLDQDIIFQQSFRQLKKKYKNLKIEKRIPLLPPVQNPSKDPSQLLKTRAIQVFRQKKREVRRTLGTAEQFMPIATFEKKFGKESYKSMSLYFPPVSIKENEVKKKGVERYWVRDWSDNNTIYARRINRGHWPKEVVELMEQYDKKKEKDKYSFIEMVLPEDVFALYISDTFFEVYKGIIEELTYLKNVALCTPADYLSEVQKSLSKKNKAMYDTNLPFKKSSPFSASSKVLRQFMQQLMQHESGYQKLESIVKEYGEKKLFSKLHYSALLERKIEEINENRKKNKDILLIDDQGRFVYGFYDRGTYHLCGIPLSNGDGAKYCFKTQNSSYYFAELLFSYTPPLKKGARS